MPTAAELLAPKPTETAVERLSNMMVANSIGMSDTFVFILMVLSDMPGLPEHLKAGALQLAQLHGRMELGVLNALKAQGAEALAPLNMDADMLAVSLAELEKRLEAIENALVKLAAGSTAPAAKTPNPAPPSIIIP